MNAFNTGNKEKKPTIGRRVVAWMAVAAALTPFVLTAAVLNGSLIVPKRFTDARLDFIRDVPSCVHEGLPDRISGERHENTNLR